jgi:hypothetical protein
MPMAVDPDHQAGNTLAAIERFNQLLTEQVIPRLSGALGEGQPNDDLPQTPDELAPDRQVPAAATQALSALYQSVSSEQIEGLAQLFNVIADVSENDGEEEPVDDAEVQAPVH